tara:strand:+ start:2107 stop:2457 length:351 start_codon:yes stop_codon:yes gene_type:complete
MFALTRQKVKCIYEERTTLQQIPKQGQKMPTNKEVINSFLNEKRTSKMKNLWTDGSFLYSYHTAIASIINKSVVITDYTAPFNISQTTSQHVNLVKRACAAQNIKHVVVKPINFGR